MCSWDPLTIRVKCESSSSRFQPGEGPSRGLFRDYEPSDGPSFESLETSHKIWQGINYLRIKLELCSAPPENILLWEEFLFHQDFAKLRKLNWTNFFCDMMQKLEYKERPQRGCGILNKVHNLSGEIYICLSLYVIVLGFN